MDSHEPWLKPLVNKNLQYFNLGLLLWFSFREKSFQIPFDPQAQFQLKTAPRLLWYTTHCQSIQNPAYLLLTISVFFLARQENPYPCFCTRRFNTPKMKPMGDWESNSAAENTHNMHQYCIFSGGGDGTTTVLVLKVHKWLIFFH